MKFVYRVFHSKKKLYIKVLTNNLHSFPKKFLGNLMHVQKKLDNLIKLQKSYFRFEILYHHGSLLSKEGHNSSFPKKKQAWIIGIIGRFCEREVQASLPVGPYMVPSIMSLM